MTTRSKPLLSVIALVAGCSLGEGSKNACNLQADCLPGYMCVDHLCVDSSSNGPVDARGKFYGSVEPLASQSAGVTASGYHTLVAVTTAPGTLGCAVVGDLQASPGPDTAVVYATVKTESGNARCPEGVFAIVNDPTLCTPPSFPSETLREGCAFYKRWDAAGELAAYQLATGGYVSVTETVLGSMSYRCNAEMSIRFAGGAVIAKTWMFEYNPAAPTSAFCGH